MKKIILASSSVYRKEQLERLNVAFTTIAPNIDEAPLKRQHDNHKQLSVELSLLKARNIAADNKNAIVIGGDQVASFNNTVLSKPKTIEKAFEQLKALSGNEHCLITSLAILFEGKEYLHTNIAKLKMRPLTNEQINNYIYIDKPLECCGSYRIEAMGISLFDEINCTDHTAIIGIPLLWTTKMLSQLGVAIP